MELVRETLAGNCDHLIKGLKTTKPDPVTWVRVVKETTGWCVVVHGADENGNPDEDNFMVVARGEAHPDARMLAEALTSILDDIVEYNRTRCGAV